MMSSNALSSSQPISGAKRTGFGCIAKRVQKWKGGVTLRQERCMHYRDEDFSMSHYGVVEACRYCSDWTADSREPHGPYDNRGAVCFPN